MATLSPFTWQEVEAKGKKPWTTQQTFSREIDTGSMSETAAAYARAASEARDVTDLAQEATDVSEEAGNLNGAPLVKDGRFQETHRALQGGGSDMDNVVRHIVRGMNHAIDAEKESHQHVYWMNGRLAAHNQAAQNEWQAAGQALAAAASNHKGDGPVTFSHNGRSYSAEMTSIGVPGGSRATLPQGLADEIRNRHLQNAVRDASHTYDEIKDAIDTYRHKLTMEAGELAELGYELADGPFTLFATPEMARYTAGKLKEELGKKHPDPELLETYTAGLQAIVESIYGNARAPEDAQRNLTAQELEYLKAFYNGLDAQTLARLGNLGNSGLAVETAKNSVANGIMMLTNPDIGGLSIGPSGGQPGTDSLPESIQFFFDRSGDVNWDWVKNEDEFRATMDMYNGFGGLMQEATVAPGDGFARSLANQAVYVQEQSEFDDGLHFTGASGMLKAAALNTDVTADLLSEDQFHRDLLSRKWDDSTGVATFVENGTTVPEGMDRNSPEAQRYYSAAQNVLTYAAQHPDDIRGQWLKGQDPGDHTALLRAVGNTALEHMDLLSREAPGGARDWTPGERQWINGQWYEHGFDFAGKDRQDLFSLMNSAPEDVRDDFFTDVAGWQYQTAYDAFQRGGDSVGLDLSNIGTIAGAAAHARNAADPGDLQSQLASANAAKVVFDAAGAIPGNVTAPVTWPFKAGFEAQAGDLQEQIDAREAGELKQLEDWGSLPARLLIADAAHAAGADGTGEPSNGRPGTTQNPSNWNNLNEYTKAILNDGRYLTPFNTAYDHAIGEQPRTDSVIPDPKVTETP